MKAMLRIRLKRNLPHLIWWRLSNTPVSGLCKARLLRRAAVAHGPRWSREPSKAVDDCCQPKVTGANRGWLLLPHMHKPPLDFPEPDIQAVKRGFLPSMSAVSPKLLMLHCS